MQLTTFEKHTLAALRANGLLVVGMVDAQFAAILLLPIVIEVHNHRKFAAFVVLKLVEVLGIKTAFFVESIMKFIAFNTRVAGVIKEKDKAIHEVKKAVFVDIIVGAVEPVNFIPPQ